MTNELIFKRNQDRALVNPTNTISSPTIDISSPNLPNPTVTSTITRARFFDIKLDPNSPEFAQAEVTLEKFFKAMPSLAPVANALKEKGFDVQTGEIDAPIQPGWEETIGEIRKDEGRIVAWKSRGEVMYITPQISSPNGTEIIQVTQNLVTNQSTEPKTINFIEGVSITQQPQVLPEISNNQTTNTNDLSNNPFLNAPANLKKAA